MCSCGHTLGVSAIAAISTDIIVGFPGETDADFEATLDVVRDARFANAFTFQYSPRPGTPAATLPDQLPKAVVQERYERLVGRRVELLVAEGEGRKDASTHRLTGRAPDNRLVHFNASSLVEPVETTVRPGDLVEVEISYAAPHHLVADGPVLSVRRTRSGDAWEARHAAPKPSGVSLGLPTIGVPEPLPAAPTCS